MKPEPALAPPHERSVSRKLAGHVALVYAICMLAMVPLHGVAAEVAPGSDDKAQTPNSGNDFTGDRLVLESNMYDLIRWHDEDPDWIAMKGTILRVTHDPGTGDVLAVVLTTPCVVEQSAGKMIARRDRIHMGVGALVDCPTSEAEIGKLVKAGDIYKISKQKLTEYGYYRSGWVYGALLVPYKYFFHDKSFASATTIGPYLGYSMGGLGFNTSFVASVGLSSLAVANPNGDGDTSTIQGFSAAIGLIGGVYKNNNPLRFGILLGKDWAGSNSTVPYKHEGKTWVAVQIGFSFSD